MKCPICQRKIEGHSRFNSDWVCSGGDYHIQLYYNAKSEINWYAIRWTEPLTRQQYTLYSENDGVKMTEIKSRRPNSQDTYRNTVLIIPEFLPLSFEADQETIINPIPKLLKLAAFI